MVICRRTNKNTDDTGSIDPRTEKEFTYHVPMFLYVYRLMVCNFLFSNLDQVSRIYKQEGVAKKQPADCPLLLGLSSLCEQGLRLFSMYGHSGRVAISRWSKV